MSPRTVERVDNWDAVPFGGGYRGLCDLVSREFSGVVTAGPARLFAIRGTVVGVLDGTIDDFEDADGTAREAPHPALPLLAVMQERSDEVRAKYYTEETPISDVNRTLEDGGFTGYVELSENVLSGDYYQVYHQGRSMSVAYVGSAERLITDDEAFQQADDEVGIYEVRPVDIEPIEVPEPAEESDEAAASTPSAAPEAGGGVDGSTGGDATADASDADAADATTANAATDAPDADGPAAGDGPGAGDGSTAEPADDAGRTDPEPSAEGTTAAATESGTGDPDPDRADRRADASAVADPADGSDDPRDADTDARPEGPADRDRHPAGGESADGERTDAFAADPGASAEPDRGGEGRGREDPARARSETTDTDASRRGSPGQPDATPPGGQSGDGDAPSNDQARSDPTGPGEAADGPDADAGATPATAAQGGDGGAADAADLETRSIPSLNPARTETASKAASRQSPPGSSGASAKSPQQSRSRRADQPATPEANGGTQQSRDSAGQQSDGAGPAGQGGRRQSAQGSDANQSAGRSGPAAASAQAQQTDGSAQSGEVATLERELAAREEELEDLRTDLERVAAERDDLATARDDLQAERERLEADLAEAREEVERLEARLEDADEEGGVAAETQLSRSQAIDETNLFVRYRSKGEATLESAHAGDADRGAVADNLRLEYHTQFDAGDAAVGSEPFDDFLTDTIQYRFVEWLVEHLLYEIRDTGHADAMAELYDALPKIDRAELNGQVSVTYTENGEEHRSQERFDVVVRDRMGNPLVVANINDSRDPATESMMTDLVKRAERVGESSDSLASAVLVTESFFEPAALETAEEATSSGLFSRDKRKSFVNLSRKGGYHLCLVEARNREFHLAVPEL